MPRIASDDGLQQTHRIGGSSFNFTGVRLEDLGATEYTLVTIAVDVTGSTAMFADDLRKMLIVAIEACKKSPRSDNLLVRIVTFSTSVGGVRELHGFEPLSSIDPKAYPQFQPDGLTPLYDATFSSVGAMVQYGGDLMESDYLANGIAFIVTDGFDNVSSTSPSMIAEQVSRARREEKLESLLTILIGINASEYAHQLETFRREAGLDQYIDAGEVSQGRLAKLASFVSQSVSSQSQALGTGGPSQNIGAII